VNENFQYLKTLKVHTEIEQLLSHIRTSYLNSSEFLTQHYDHSKVVQNPTVF